MEKRPHTRHPAPVWDAARATYLTGQTLSDVALAHIAKLARYDSITDPVTVIVPSDV